MPHSLPSATLPLREGLRVLRHGLRQGRRLGQMVSRGALQPVDGQAPLVPPVIAPVVAPVIDMVDALAGRVDGLAHLLARRVLGGVPQGAVIAPLSFDALADLPGDVAAGTLYPALRHILRRLQAHDAHISELALRQAHAALGHTAQVSDDAQNRARRAAHFAMALADWGIVWQPAPLPGLQSGRDMGPMAILGLLLWLLARPDAQSQADALDAVTDMALALPRDVANSLLARDGDRLGAALVGYAAYV